MVKKGMTKREVLKHLKDLKTNKGKIGYLRQMIQRKDLLSIKTLGAVYEIKGDLSKNKSNRRTCYDFAAKHYEIAGYFEKAAESFEKAAESFDEETPSGVTITAKLREKAAENYEKVNRPLNSAKMWEKAGDYEKAADNYEEARHGVSAKRARKKARKKKSLESKLPMILLIGALCIGGYYLFSNPNITGNVVASLSGVSSSFMSLILIGVLVLVIYYYNK